MNAKKVLIFDTSVLCCWLQVPTKDTCGPENDQWDHSRIEKLVQSERQAGSTFVLPVASIIETGNHIAQINGDRYTVAKALADKMKDAAEKVTPWAAFSDQSNLWTTEKLNVLAEEWPQLATQGLGIGDATIKDVADYYASIGSFAVEILTGDQGLKAHQPSVLKTPPPRRRQRI